MDIRAEVYSPLQNTTVWLGAWLHGVVPTDELLDALMSLGGTHVLDTGVTHEPIAQLLRTIRELATSPGTGLGTGLSRNAATATGAGLPTHEPVLRLILSGPGEASGLPRGAQEGIVITGGADPLHPAVLLPYWDDDAEVTAWTLDRLTQPARTTAGLSPGEADQLLADATRKAADIIEASGYRTDALHNPRLTVGTLSDFYDAPGLPSATPPRAAKLFARADRVAAIIETVTQRMGDHSLDPQLFALWRHIRTARMAGCDYAVAEFGRRD